MVAARVYPSPPMTGGGRRSSTAIPPAPTNARIAHVLMRSGGYSVAVLWLTVIVKRDWGGSDEASAGRHLRRRARGGPSRPVRDGGAVPGRGAERSRLRTRRAGHRADLS